MSLGKVIEGKSLGKKYDAWSMLFGFCSCMLGMPKFRHKCVTTYHNFMVILWEASNWGPPYHKEEH